MSAGRVAATAQGSYRRPALRVHRMTPGVPKVVVAHDCQWLPPLVRQCTEGRADLIGGTTFGEVALVLCDLLEPHVTIVGDVLADGLIDRYLTALMRTGTRVMLVADALEAERAAGLVARGVMGLVTTDRPPQDLADAVVAVAAGGAVFPPDVTAAVAGAWRLALRAQPPAAPPGALTGRELEVLSAMTDGLSTKAVARLLGIAPKTVENHKTRVFEKLGVRTQAQAVAVVLEGRLETAAAEEAIG